MILIWRVTNKGFIYRRKSQNHLLYRTKQYHIRVLLNNVHLNGHTLRFHPDSKVRITLYHITDSNSKALLYNAHLSRLKTLPPCSSLQSTNTDTKIRVYLFFQVWHWYFSGSPPRGSTPPYSRPRHGHGLHWKRRGTVSTTLRNHRTRKLRKSSRFLW